MSLAGISGFGAQSSALAASEPGSPAFLRSLSHLDTPLLAQDLLQLDLFLSLRSFAWFESFLFLLDLAHLDVPSALRSLTYSESLMLTLGRAKPGVSIFALDFVIVGKTAFVQNVQRLSLTLLAESLTLGSPLSLRSFVQVGSVAFPYGAGCSGLSSLILTTLPLESSPFVQSHAYFDPSVLTLSMSKTGAKLPAFGTSGPGFVMFLRNLGWSEPTTSPPDCSSFGLGISSKALQWLGLTLFALQMGYLASSLSAMDSTLMGRSLSLQSVGQVESRISLFGTACLAAFLFVFDCHQPGSSPPPQSLASPGPAPFVSDLTSLGFSLFPQQGFCLEISSSLLGANWFELPVLVLDPLHLGLPSSIRSCRLGLISFLFAAVRTESLISVFGEQSFDSPALLQSMMCLDIFMFTLSAARSDLLTFVLAAGLLDFSFPSKSLACTELCLLPGMLTRFGSTSFLLDVSEMELLLPLRRLFWSLSCIQCSEMFPAKTWKQVKRFKTESKRT